MKTRITCSELGLYRHFKGSTYRVLSIAYHSETKEKLVIYQLVKFGKNINPNTVWYKEGDVFARPYDMFFSEVDKEKYPEVKQLYRFERIKEGITW